MNLIRFILAKGLNRSSVEIVLDLIYATTDLQFPADKITFGLATTIDVQEYVENGVNTFVPISVDIEFDDRFTGPKKDNFHYEDCRIDGFLYRRIPLSLLTPSGNVLLEEPKVYPFRTHDILDEINRRLNSKLTTDDLINDVHIRPTGYIRLRAAAHSLAWIDEVVLFFDSIEGRQLEDGSLRITENDIVRDLEDELAPAP